MAKITLSIKNPQNILLHTSKVENFFISEVMPNAPGEYVKVYFLALMHAQCGLSLESKEISTSLNISEDDVEEAWTYWEALGAISRHTELTPGGIKSVRIEINSMADKLISPPQESQKYKSENDAYSPMENSGDDIIESRLVDKALHELFLKYQDAAGRTISREETRKITDAIKVYEIDPDIFSYAIDYCDSIGKYKIDYIFKVARNWTEDGCETVEDAKAAVDKHSLRNSYYSRIFKGIGLNRPYNDYDKEMMDIWFDEMGFSIDDVLNACRSTAGMRDPDLRYVNRILEKRKLEKGGININPLYAAPKPAEHPSTGTNAVATGESPVSRKVLSDYYAYIRNEEEESFKARTREIEIKIPEMKKIFKEEKELTSKLFELIPGEGSKNTRSKLKAKRQETEQDKRKLLSDNGYPEDYLARRYRCTDCKDTGYTDNGMTCHCCRIRADEAYKWYNAVKQKTANP